MITVQPPRERPKNRVQTPSDKRPSNQVKTYLAPIGGLVTNQALAAQMDGAAVVLDNFWPTETGVEPRGGSVRRVNIAGAVESLFEYRSGLNEQFFAADASNIYSFNRSTPDETILTAAVTGQTSGDYVTLEMQTDGGSFLSVVNGSDPLQMYDGTSWQQVTATSTPHSITGLQTDRVSFLWSYRNRQFMVEKNTMNAWYLGVNSVSGSALKYPLAGVFKKGGSLLFGGTWSSDSGDGMDDRCVFVTDQGEFAVYAGGNPSDSNDWGLIGVYDIGQPLGRKSHMSIGGDLIVATKEGLIPISAAVHKEPAELKTTSIARSIDPDWREEISLAGSSGDWRLLKWPSRNLAMAIPPGNSVTGASAYTVNLSTNAWATISGWRISSAAVLDDALHYGDASGQIFVCDLGGQDDGLPFLCQGCLTFDHLGAPGTFKVAQLLRTTWRASVPFGLNVSVATDYVPSFPAAPNASPIPGGLQASWDTAMWDQAAWADSDERRETTSRWVNVAGQGRTLAVQFQVTSGASRKLDCELISADLSFQTGAVVA